MADIKEILVQWDSGLGVSEMNIGGGHVYLTGNGGIGPDGAVEGVGNELETLLANYGLPEPPNADEEARAVNASLGLLTLGSPSVIAPLLGIAYLAPLRELLSEEKPDFQVWVNGKSGAGKSELAAVILSHFGHFTRQDLKVSFTGTANALEHIASLLKDSLGVIDDYFPPIDAREQSGMDQAASRVLRNAGNGASRARLRADSTLQKSYVAQCVTIVTAERLPGGQSTVARMLQVLLQGGDITLENLTEMQERRPLLARAMAGYIRWLARHFDELNETLGQRYRELRGEAQSVRAQGREPGQLAHLQLGLETFTSYAQDIGALSAEERQAVLSQTWGALMKLGSEQASAAKEHQMEVQVVNWLNSGFSTRRVYLTTTQGTFPGKDGAKFGWTVDYQLAEGPTKALHLDDDGTEQYTGHAPLEALNWAP